MNWRRGVRATLIGAIVFIFGLIYVPQCRVRIYVDHTTWLSLGAGAVMAFVAYRYQ